MSLIKKSNIWETNKWTFPRYRVNKLIWSGNYYAATSYHNASINPQDSAIAYRYSEYLLDLGIGPQFANTGLSYTDIICIAN